MKAGSKRCFGLARKGEDKGTGHEITLHVDITGSRYWAICESATGIMLEALTGPSEEKILEAAVEFLKESRHINPEFDYVWAKAWERE